jgi:hypothetical protein
MADLNLRPLEPGDVLGAALLPLLRFGLTRREQLVVRAILLSRTPPSALKVAKRTGLAYSHVKAAVRTLVAWQILTRSAEGLCFQPEASRWGPPTVPVPPNDVETDRSPRAARER